MADTVRTDVAVIIPARNEQRRIGATVMAATAISDVVIVVDDASDDGTGDLALAAGAVVIRRPRSHGKAAAMMTGAQAVADIEARSARPNPRHLLFLDADLERTAIETRPLVIPVSDGSADMSIAILPSQLTDGGGHGLVVRLARYGIRRSTGFSAEQPLSGMRCISREAFNAVQPLARGWGVETALIIDILAHGYTITEVPVNLHHRVSGHGLRAQLHRGHQLIDVAQALTARYFSRIVDPR
jgi:glucosyl-3-phosphoglycerate synthase